MSSYNVSIIDDEHCESFRGKGDYADWRETKTHDIQGFKLVKEKEYFDLTVAFKPQRHTNYYLLYVLYSSGDSFGHSSGNICFVGLYEDERTADRNAKRIVEHNNCYRKRDYKWKDHEEEYSVELEEPDCCNVRFSCAWNGYFERIEDVVVMAVSMDGNKRSYVNG